MTLAVGPAHNSLSRTRRQGPGSGASSRRPGHGRGDTGDSTSGRRTADTKSGTGAEEELLQGYGGSLRVGEEMEGQVQAAAAAGDCRGTSVVARLMPPRWTPGGVGTLEGGDAG